MILANISVGTGAGNNDGESIYSAFTKVNRNFANVQSNVNSLSNSVTSVAGKQGNVTLTVNDIDGFNSTTIINSTPPATATSPGTQGQMIVSSGYLYICHTANQWVRIAVASSWS